MLRFLRASSGSPSPAAALLEGGAAGEAVVAGLKAVAGAAALQAAAPVPALRRTELGSRCVTFSETATDWYAYWARVLLSAPRPHRKLWEFVAVMQGVFDRGLLVPGARALGMGVGDEPVSSALASFGLPVVATDLPDALSAGRVHKDALLSREDFEARVSLQAVDVLGAADDVGADFDVVWSCGLLSALGGLERAQRAMEAAASRLQPGGVAFHAFDVDLMEDGNSYALSLAEFEQLARQAGGRVDVSLGRHPLDGYIDLPPFSAAGLCTPVLFADGSGAPHLKAMVDGRAVTSVIVIQQR